MNDQRIVMRFVERVGVEMIPTTAYDIKFTKRWRWIQRLCWWILLKTKGTHPHFDERQLVKSVVIDKDKAVSEIVRLAEDQLSRFRYERPQKILMGGAQFSRFMTEDVSSMSRFTFDVNLVRTKPRTLDDRYGTGMEMFSVPVDVIPWMDGVLVL